MGAMNSGGHEQPLGGALLPLKMPRRPEEDKVAAAEEQEKLALPIMK